MGCCPGGIFKPLVRDCNGNIVFMPLGGALLTDIADHPVIPLSADLIIYVKTMGDDVSGAGTETNPYASVPRALEHVKTINPGIFDIEVNIEEGLYTLTDTIRPELQFGERVTWKGDMDTHDGAGDLVFSSIDASHSTDGDYANMQFFDCIITLPSGFTSAVGQFIGVNTPTGGTNPEACYGVHEVISWDGGPREATVRIWSLLNTTEIASGSVVSKGHVFKTVLNFNMDGQSEAIKVRGPHHGGLWTDLVVAGVGTNGWANTLAVSTRIHAQIEFGIAGIHNWLVGLDTRDSGFISAQATYVSKINAQMLLLISNAVANVTGSIFTGCSALTAISATTISVMIGTSIKVVGAGRAQTIQVAIGSTADLRSAELYFDDGAATGIKAILGSKIIATSSSVTGYSTDYDPTQAASPSADFSTIQTA